MIFQSYNKEKKDAHVPPLPGDYTVDILVYFLPDLSYVFHFTREIEDYIQPIVFFFLTCFLI